MNKIKVLITGAGGFLGSYIARDLNATGKYEIYSFSRNLYSALDKYNVTQTIGDITNLKDVLHATQGMDAIIHTASLVSMWGTYQSFYNTNVIGTQNILEAMRVHGIKKLVYTSTPSVVFGKSDINGANEALDYPKKYYSNYAQTKAIAEELVLNANSDEMATVAIRPHLIFGPGDLNLIPRIIEAQKRGKLKIVGEGDNLVDVTYVENASLLHVRALEKLDIQSRISGKAYFLGQGPVKLWDFTNEILMRSGLNKVEKKIPLKLAFILGFFTECVLRLIGKYNITPPMTRFMAMQLGMNHYYNHDALKEDLDFIAPFSIEEGLNKLFSQANQSNQTNQ